MTTIFRATAPAAGLLLAGILAGCGCPGSVLSVEKREELFPGYRSFQKLADVEAALVSSGKVIASRERSEKLGLVYLRVPTSYLDEPGILRLEFDSGLLRSTSFFATDHDRLLGKLIEQGIDLKSVDHYFYYSKFGVIGWAQDDEGAAVSWTDLRDPGKRRGCQ